MSDTLSAEDKFYRDQAFAEWKANRKAALDFEDGCEQCGETSIDGCIHASGCCGASIIEGTDCCSDCKEHTGVENY